MQNNENNPAFAERNLTVKFTLTGCDMLVYVFIMAEMGHPEGACRLPPSLAADRLGITRTDWLRSVRNLEVQGLIETTREPGTITEHRATSSAEWGSEEAGMALRPEPAA